MSQTEDILKGWWNQIRAELGILPEHIKTLAESRLKVCQKCPHRVDTRCGVCGCPLGPKSKSTTTNCPKGFWLK